MLPFNMHSKRVFGVVSAEALRTLVGHLAVVGLDVREEVGLEGCGVGTISAAPASAVRQSLHLPFYRGMVACRGQHGHWSETTHGTTWSLVKNFTFRVSENTGPEKIHQKSLRLLRKTS